MSKILPKFIKIEPLIALGLSALLLIFAYVLKSTPETLTYTFRNGVIQKHSDHEFFQVIAGLTILLVVLLCFAGSIGCIAVWLRHKQKTAGKAAAMPRTLGHLRTFFDVYMEDHGRKRCGRGTNGR